MQINSIVIVGGGSAGWMTAASLSKNVPEIDVTIIESPNVPTIGVGESSTLHINRYLQSIGIHDEDWMSQCDATYKGSIKFTDFYKKGEFFHYPFGFQDFSRTSYGTDAWFLKKWIYPDTPQTDFCESYWPNMQMINKNKIHSNEDDIIPLFNISGDFAYQFDATKFGNWLKTNRCTKVNYILDHVTDVDLDDRGWISMFKTVKDRPIYFHGIELTEEGRRTLNWVELNKDQAYEWHEHVPHGGTCPTEAYSSLTKHKKSSPLNRHHPQFPPA